MFDLIAFIRQLLPPHRRTALNTGFVELFFAPIRTLLVAIEATRGSLLLQARATGQVLVLEELCNRAAFGSSVGGIYLLEGNSSSFDFQVVIPSNLSEATRNKVYGVLDAHKQAGKRYTILADASYEIVVPVALAWEAGYPSLSTDRLSWAINRTGSYQTLIVADGTTLLNGPLGYVAGVPRVLDNGTASSISITIDAVGGGVTASLTRSSLGVISQLSYVRTGSSLFILAWINEGDVEAKLEGRNGTSFTDSFSDAAVYGASQNGVSYNRRRLLQNVSDGHYKVSARVKGQTAVTAIDIDLTTANLPPVVVNPIPDQNAKVGSYFTLSIPSNTFTDPDGNIAGYAVTGLPAGLSYTLGQPISGTPTTAGTSTVRVTATDNRAATVYDEFQLVVAAANAPDPEPPNPPTQPGSTGIVRFSSDVMNLVAENNGSKWRVRDTLNRPMPGGQYGSWFVNGQLYQDSLPTAYEYLPGDEIIVYYVIASTRHVYDSEWNVKSWAKVVFGTI